MSERNESPPGVYNHCCAGVCNLAAAGQRGTNPRQGSTTHIAVRSVYAARVSERNESPPGVYNLQAAATPFVAVAGQRGTNPRQGSTTIGHVFRPLLVREVREERIPARGLQRPPWLIDAAIRYGRSERNESPPGVYNLFSLSLLS